MNHKILNVLFIAGICALFLFGCKEENPSPVDSGIFEGKPNLKAETSNPNLLLTVGSNSQDFYELKSSGTEQTRLLMLSPWSDFDPTGFYLPPKTTMRIVVKQLQGTKRPVLLVGTYSRYQACPNPQEFTLTADTNNITSNEYGGLIWVRFRGSGIPASKVNITFLSGHVPVPVYIKNKTTSEAWLNQLETFNQAPDVVLIGDRVYQVYSRERALNSLEQNNSSVLRKADLVMNVEDAISGLDGSAPEHQPNIHQRVLMTEKDNGYMSATSYRTSYVTSAASAAFDPRLGSINGWGPWHELGHMHQQRWRWSTQAEVTVNIFSLAVERAFGITPSTLKRNGSWPLAMSYLADSSANKNFNDNAFMPKNNNWVRLCMYHQLWLAYGDIFYQNLHKKFRTDRPVMDDDEQKMRHFMLISCKVSGHNLTNFFKKWGFRVNESIYNEIAALNLPQPAVEPSTLSE